ncbi:restriction endonuclease [Chloroflexota bacterium]
MTWRDYQENAAKLFTQLGCNTEIDATVQGARAHHNIDVWVTFNRFGLEHKWVIECKLYNRRIPKEKVLVLQGVVNDVGADRGILIAESGYQYGAYDAAQSTNIDLLTLDELRERAKMDLLSNIFYKLEEKTILLIELIHKLFWPEPEPWYSTPRPGVDEDGMWTQVGKLAMLKRNMEQVRLSRFPVVVGATYTPQEKLVFARNLDEFVEKAGQTFEEVEKWAKVQEVAIRKLEGNP